MKKKKEFLTSSKIVFIAGLFSFLIAIPLVVILRLAASYLVSAIYQANSSAQIIKYIKGLSEAEWNLLLFRILAVVVNLNFFLVYPRVLTRNSSRFDALIKETDGCYTVPAGIKWYTKKYWKPDLSAIGAYIGFSILLSFAASFSLPFNLLVPPSFAITSLGYLFGIILPIIILLLSWGCGIIYAEKVHRANWLFPSDRR